MGMIYRMSTIPIASTDLCTPSERIPTKDQIRAGCASCSIRELCLPVGLSPEDVERLDSIVRKRRRVPKGSYLFRPEAPFTSLFAVSIGHFKTEQYTSAGKTQITGFQLPGDLLGMDAIATGRHQCFALALDDAEVCEIPYDQLEQLFLAVPGLLRQFNRLMSHEINREQTAMVLLGNMTAEQRFANFLTNLSSRYASRGYSATRFDLRMSREEIGEYLGLTIESISRLVSKFKKHKVLKVDGRDVEILDIERLRSVATGTTALT